MFEKKAFGEVQIHDLMASRWSGRAFDEERAVEHEKLHAILESARWTPSCFGDQPWRCLVWDRFVDAPAFEMACDCLSDSNKFWAKRAPLLILSAANSLFSDGRVNRWAEYDTGAASMSLSLEATAQGLMVHQMAGFDAGKLRSAFSIPDQFVLMAVIAVGYQLPEAKIPDDLRDREFAVRSRRPLSDNFFEGEWGRGFTSNP